MLDTGVPVSEISPLITQSPEEDRGEAPWLPEPGTVLATEPCEAKPTDEPSYDWGQHCLDYLRQRGDWVAPSEIHAELVRAYGITPMAARQRWQTLARSLRESPGSPIISRGTTASRRYKWQPATQPSDATTTKDVLTPRGDESAPADPLAEGLVAAEATKDNDNLYELTTWGLTIEYDGHGGDPKFYVNGHDAAIPRRPGMVLRALIDFPVGATLAEVFRYVREHYDGDFPYDKVESGVTHLRNAFATYVHTDKIRHDGNGKFADRKYQIVGVLSEETDESSGEESDFLAAEA